MEMEFRVGMGLLSKDVARTMAEYRQSLIDAGVPEQAANTMADRFWGSLFGAVFLKKESNGNQEAFD